MSTGNFHEVSAAVSRRADRLRAEGLELHAHALEFMLASLSARDALGDWSVLEALARECDRTPDVPGAVARALTEERAANTTGVGTGVMTRAAYRERSSALDLLEGRLTRLLERESRQTDNRWPRGSAGD